MKVSIPRPPGEMMAIFDEETTRLVCEQLMTFIRRKAPRGYEAEFTVTLIAQLNTAYEDFPFTYDGVVANLASSVFSQKVVNAPRVKTCFRLDPVGHLFAALSVLELERDAYPRFRDGRRLR